MATVRVGEAVVGYGVDGTGDPLLVLHGTTMDRTAWDLVLAALPVPVTAVKVEFPGSGESPAPSAPLTVEGLAEQAIGVMDHLGHERFHVAGYSLGAVVAAAVAALGGDRVRSATLLAGWVTTDARMRFTFDLWKRLIETDLELFARYALADGLTAEGMALMEPMLEVAVPMAAAAVASGSIDQLDLDIVVDIAPLLDKIATPTLVLGGSEDRWVDISHSHQLADGIAGATMVELPAGHLVIQERAADVARLLRDHMAAHP